MRLTEHNRIRFASVVNTPVFVYGRAMKNLTPEAMRAARGILKWSLRDLAKHSGVGLTAIHQAEAGRRDSHQSTVAAIIATFAANGVEILDDGKPGARVL